MIVVDDVQHVIVALAALVAAGILVRRLVGAARPAPGAAPACANCPSNATACHAAAPAPPQAASADRTEHPLVFVRPPGP